MSDEKYYHIAEAYANVEVDADLDADADADPEVNAADADDQSTVGDMYRATPVHQYSPGSSASDSDSDASAARPSAPHTSDAAPSSAPRRHPAVPSGRKGRDVAASGGVTSRTPKSAGIDTQEARKRQRERENNLVKAREAAARNRASGGRKTAVQSLQLPYRIVKKIMKIDDEVSKSNERVRVWKFVSHKCLFLA
mmetsp:Transcript_10519/g.23213  ORF Transcript_10519/g.23213 Transcript_10519/m.23213 type:complete len:196 (-) Transcript_10519:301-888(-)